MYVLHPYLHEFRIRSVLSARDGRMIASGAAFLVRSTTLILAPNS
jgi:hypothetical protein